MSYRTVANGAPPPNRATTTKKRSARSRNRGPHASCGLGTRDHCLWPGHPHEARILTRSWWWRPSPIRGIPTQTEWPRWCAHMQGWSRRIDLHMTWAPPTDHGGRKHRSRAHTDPNRAERDWEWDPLATGTHPTPGDRCRMAMKRLPGARTRAIMVGYRAREPSLVSDSLGEKVD